MAEGWKSWAEGLSLFGGNGIHRRNADKAEGIALREARKHKERTYPEPQVIAGEVGGKLSAETKASLWNLASEKSRSEARVLRGSVRAAWCRRCCLVACAAAKAVALSLLERQGLPRVGDDEVVAATFGEV